MTTARPSVASPDAHPTGPVIQREYTVPILTGLKQSIPAGKDARQVVPATLTKLLG